MQISGNGLNLIKEFEGLRLTAYQCSAGVWTIGYGHTRGVTAGMTITKVQAEKYLEADVKWTENAVNELHREWTQNQFDALCSFTFNCGAGNLRKLCANRDVDAIEKAIPLYNKAAGKVLNGLIRRREAERKLFATIDIIYDDKCYPSYVGDSENLDNIMDTIGAKADYESWRARIPIAEANGITNYTGTAQQNLKLIDLAKTGKLRRP